jgi:hypothetical protein
VVFDDKENFMYRITTDGAGVKTVKRFPYIDEDGAGEEAAPAWLSKLNERLDSMDERISALSNQRQPRTRKAASDE